ncbi:hypothetical protein [Alteraurantiacibacter buctensis]|uniref:Uncharacterized protein n=1 Tax=Alteraurantiacibacter buctensis TaxID=1503981 RepID=A0A844YXE7_9SPHN|nr:hypothetical protein [Alteraurantiacibacter buctensis]MXO71630.1 hypothetical protein [Alteraurantiacibacter buctensis]
MAYSELKALAKRRLGRFYPVMVRAKSSGAVRKVRALPGALAYARWKGTGQAAIGLDIDTPIGMGAIVCHALLLHDHFERAGIACHLRATSPFYARPGQDVLARHFIAEPWPADVRMLPSKTCDFIIEYLRPDHMDLQRASELVQRHFRPTPLLADAIEEGSQGFAAFDLAIHYRGTDKSMEATTTSADAALAEIERQLQGLADPVVFLATDIPAFAQVVRARFPRARFVSYDIGDVASGTARYRSTMNPDDKALEALVNSFLIARAKVCVRTVSYLSAVAAVINPQMRTITLNTLIGNDPPFPELEIARREGKAG